MNNDAMHSAIYKRLSVTVRELNGFASWHIMDRQFLCTAMIFKILVRIS